MKLFNRTKSIIGIQGAIASAGIIKPVNYLKEALKGLVLNKKVRFPRELGLAHPFEYHIVEQLLKKFGIINAIVDKHIDYIFASGINVASEDKRAKEIIEDFMRDFNFLSTIKPWVKEGLSKGAGFLEIGVNKEGTIDGLKTLKSDFMFIDRDDTGKFEGFNQFTKPIQQFNSKTQDKEVEPFDLDKIAYLPMNKFADNAYGMGIVWPLMSIINDLVGSRKELHTLMRRKANNPYIFLMGDKATKQYPNQSDMDKLKNKLEDLNNLHEWVLSDMVKPMTLDSGNIGAKFEFVIENDLEVLFMAAQIPSVLMGKAKVPEGLAKEQKEGWMFRIAALREEIEKVIEESIFKRVLQSNGIDAHVEIVWGLPSSEEKKDKLTILNEIVKNPFVSPNFKFNVEKQMAIILDIPEDEVQEPEEEREEEESKEKQPVVPSQRAKKASPAPPDNGRAKDSPKEHIYHENCQHTTESIEEQRNMNIEEWVGFNYKKYSEDVMTIIKEDRFDLLKAKNKIDIKAGLLRPIEIEKLRVTMQDVLEKNGTIRQMENNLNKRIKFKNRLAMKDGQIILNSDGSFRIALTAAQRAIAIARSETVRISNLGAIKNYKKNGVVKVRWVSAMSERTCEFCDSQNGIIYPINSGVMPPLHTMCRCTLVPVIE